MSTDSLLVAEGTFLLSTSNLVLYVQHRAAALAAGSLLSHVLRKPTIVRQVTAGYTIQPEGEDPVIRGAKTIQICTPDE